MTNVFLNSQVYANTMLLLFKNALVMGRLVDGQFKDQVTDENGLTVNVKRPPRFVDTKDGTAALVAQDLVTGSMPVAVNQYSKVHISIGDIEYITSYNSLMQNESMKSAASTLAHSVDMYLAGFTKKFHSWIAGTAPGTIAANASDPTKLIATSAMANAGYARLRSQGVPDADLQGVINFDDASSILGSLAYGVDNPDIVRSSLERTRVPMLGSVDWYATQHCPNLTTGTRLQGDGSSAGYQVNAAGGNVNYRDVKGSAGVPGMIQTLALKSAINADTIKIGEVFTIQGVYAWDWRAQQALPYLQQFTVVGDSAGAATDIVVSGTTVTVTISPPIIVQGTTDGTNTYANSAFGTVAQAPLSNAYVKWVGAPSVTTQIKSVFNKRAIALVSARLQMPFTGSASMAMDSDTGIAIRYWRGSDISTGVHVHRWDMMYGAACMDPFLGTRLCGT
jgi:hypothetical protein